MQQLSQSTGSYQKALQLEEDSLTILFASAGSCFRVVVDDANLPSRIKSTFKDVRGLFHHLQDERNYQFSAARAVLLVEGGRGGQGGRRQFGIHLSPIGKETMKED